MPRRSFDKAFKIGVVKLVTEEKFSVKKVSLQLEVHANSLYRWVQEVEKYRAKKPKRKNSFRLFGLHRNTNTIWHCCLNKN
ncbi:transposase [Enterococcus sp. RIT-PI-f]|uniref:transposase n=1 Tax=Enterococcus sp. RIT-PI-f TaxID=1690244 RepID=UPI002285B6AF|nr:transposase [Enterococcus sp. RIT-PI-f]